MATLIGNESHLVDMLKDLMELDFDAISAYQAAIERLDSAVSRAKMREFMGDHERHTQLLGPLVVELGGAPPVKGDVKEILTRGKVVIGQISGDKGILIAMRSNEEDTNTAYERAVARTHVPEHMRMVLERGLADERRHRAWIDSAIAEIDGQPSAERGEPATHRML